ncbi:MAG TPA: HlyD family efflux transporter periplasmic adaptor subunit [Chitinophaga sp.]|uniref:efflux RND transporter periplasmic adaptor subunit n=1 Tax=Chitinophaga sp. TaxID=1869181 RepID=UPI002DBFBE94|nr:HlyD family efflux transporter periplasmic adaptor subunit [Chitinophaga sp.]HEU4556166.1 HlyD family efflux transporter periplasmic adaptor subunit [Chitinophaga sp.]
MIRKYYYALLLFVCAAVCTGCSRKRAVIYPQKREIIEAVYASGKVVAEDEYSLFALSNGRIVKKLVKDGDSVHKGQVLYVVANDAAQARLEAARQQYNISGANLSPASPLLNDLQLALQSASIRLRNDSVTYFRWKRLWDQQIGSRSNLDNAYSNYQVSLMQQKIAEQKYRAALNDVQLSHSNAQSALTAASHDLQDYFIRSPSNGVVYQTFKETGEAVRNNEVVALLGTQGGRLLRLSVDQQDISRIEPRQQVLVQADVSGSKLYHATVTRVYPVMNEADQTFRVDARFQEALPGPFIHSSVEANIIIQKKSNALVLPRGALVARDSVYIPVNGGKRKVRIQTGIQTLDYVEVLAGINESTPVLLNTNK